MHLLKKSDTWGTLNEHDKLFKVHVGGESMGFQNDVSIKGNCHLIAKIAF